MAKARRHGNPLRLTSSVETVEQRVYDEAYGPGNKRRYARENREWSEDAGFAAVDIRLSAPSQALANVCEFNSLVAAVANLGFTGKELRQLVGDVDRATSEGGWMLPPSDTYIDGAFRTSIRDARQQALDCLDAEFSREGGTPA